MGFLDDVRDSVSDAVDSVTGGGSSDDDGGRSIAERTRDAGNTTTSGSDSSSSSSGGGSDDNSDSSSSSGGRSISGRTRDAGNTTTSGSDSSSSSSGGGRSISGRTRDAGNTTTSGSDSSPSRSDDADVVRSGSGPSPGDQRDISGDLQDGDGPVDLSPLNGLETETDPGRSIRPTGEGLSGLEDDDEFGNQEAVDQLSQRAQDAGIQPDEYAVRLDNGGSQRSLRLEVDEQRAEQRLLADELSKRVRDTSSELESQGFEQDDFAFSFDEDSNQVFVEFDDNAFDEDDEFEGVQTEEQQNLDEIFDEIGSERPIPDPTGLDDDRTDEQRFIDGVTGGAFSDVRDIEEEQLGDRDGREERFLDSIKDAATPLAVPLAAGEFASKRFNVDVEGDFGLDVNEESAAAAGVAVAAPEPVSTTGGLIAGAGILGAAAISGSELDVDISRREIDESELEGPDSVERQSELEAPSSIGTLGGEIDVDVEELESATSELEVETTQDDRTVTSEDDIIVEASELVPPRQVTEEDAQEDLATEDIEITEEALEDSNVEFFIDVGGEESVSEPTTERIDAIEESQNPTDFFEDEAVDESATESIEEQLEELDQPIENAHPTSQESVDEQIAGSLLAVDQAENLDSIFIDEQIESLDFAIDTTALESLDQQLSQPVETITETVQPTETAAGPQKFSRCRTNLRLPKSDGFDGDDSDDENEFDDLSFIDEAIEFDTESFDEIDESLGDLDADLEDL